MKLAFSIALRFLKSSKGQTTLIVLGIAIGVSVQVFIGSLIQGLQISLLDSTIGNAPQVTVLSTSEDKQIEQWEKKVLQLKDSGAPLKVVSPTASLPGFVQYNRQTEPILLRGFQLENADLIYGIEKNVYEGVVPTSQNEVAVGRELGAELNLQLGDSIDFLTSTGRTQAMKVTGFYDLKVSTINKSWILTNLVTVQDLFQIGNKITAIEMQIEDVFAADTWAREIELLFPNDAVEVQNWKDQNQQLLSGLQGQSVSSLMIQIFVLIAVVLGIASVLAISVLQKSRQIGILKAMGVTDFSASLIFLFQGLLLGVVGGALGIAFGLGLSFAFTKFATNPDGTPVVNLYINYGFIGLSGLIAVLSSTLAALIPAHKSSKLSPMEVIKNG